MTECISSALSNRVNTKIFERYALSYLTLLNQIKCYTVSNRKNASVA